MPAIQRLQAAVTARHVFVITGVIRPDPRQNPQLPRTHSPTPAGIVARLAELFADCADEIARAMGAVGNNILICSLTGTPANQIAEVFYVRPTSLAGMLQQITAGTIAISGVFARSGTHFRYSANV